MTEETCAPGEAKEFELAIERSIAAPPEKVWEVMTNRLEEWWCPKPWHAIIDRIEWRAGGPFDTTMKGPDGEGFSGSGLFLEVTPGKRFIFTDAISADFQPQDAFMIGIFEITPDGNGGTHYRAAARHWSEEAREKHREMGFEQGWKAAADQLAELCEST